MRLKIVARLIKKEYNMSSIIYDENLNPFIYDKKTNTYVPANSDDKAVIEEQYSKWVKEQADRSDFYIKDGIHYFKKIIYPSK